MRYCIFCGVEIPNNAGYCQICGKIQPENTIVAEAELTEKLTGIQKYLDTPQKMLFAGIGVFFVALILITGILILALS